MTKLTEIVSDIHEAPREAKPITDIPLGPRAPAPARNVEIVSQPQAKAPWRKHRRAGPELIEPIPPREAEIAQGQSQGRSQEDYYKAAQEANRATREAQRRPAGRRAVAERDKAEIAQALVGGIKRKDRT